MRKQITSRERRARKTRHKLRVLDVPRLSVHMSCQHIYAQVLAPDGSKVFAAASTLGKEEKSALKKQAANIQSAAVIGEMVAKRAVAAGISKVGFDRSGFKYHGRVKALADAARANGLIF